MNTRKILDTTYISDSDFDGQSIDTLIEKFQSIKKDFIGKYGNKVELTYQCFDGEDFVFEVTDEMTPEEIMAIREAERIKADKIKNREMSVLKNLLEKYNLKLEK